MKKHSDSIVDYSQWKSNQILKEIEKIEGPENPPKHSSKHIKKRPLTASTNLKRPYDLHRPKLYVPPDPKIFPNYLNCKGEVYPNCTTVDKKDCDDFKNLLALEQAYYISK